MLKHTLNFFSSGRSLYETSPQGIMVGVLVKANIQSMMMNTLTMAPYRRVSQRELGILEILKVLTT